MRIENGQTYWEQVVKVWPVLEKWVDSWVVDLTSNEVDDPEQGIGDIVIEELEGEPNSNYVEFVGLWYRVEGREPLKVAGYFSEDDFQFWEIF